MNEHSNPPSPRPDRTSGSGRPASSRTRGRGCADRDDPETIAYLEAENAYADRFFDEPARAALVETVFDEIKSRVQETDLSVPVLPRRLVVRHAHDRGRGVPGVLPQPRPRGARHAGLGDARLQRRGRRATSTSTSTPSSRRRTTPCSHGRATSTAASATRCASATSPPVTTSTRSPAPRRGAASPGRPTDDGCSTPGPTTRCARTRSGATASALDRPTTCSSTRARRALLPRRLGDTQRALDRHRRRRRRRAARRSSSPPTTRRRRRASCGRGAATSSTTSTTGATASSSSPTSTPPTSA